MRTIRLLLSVIALAATSTALAPSAVAAQALPLQPMIDATPAGGTLHLDARTYAGPARVDKPMILDGRGKARIEGGGRGTVLAVNAGGATVRGLVISGSGETLDGVDAGILVAGDGNLIENNVLEDVLFGIHVRQGRHNLVRGNRVRGKALPLGLRGDGLRLWNSSGNLVEGNAFVRVRDLTLANSPDNVVAGNALDDGRYGMHVVFSPRTLVERNRLARLATGIIVLYSPDLTVRGNHIAHAREGGGGGLVFKESGSALVEGNELLHCSAGLVANTPLSDERVLTVRGNRFAHNVTGIAFYGEKGGHRIEGNRFEHNLVQVSLSAVGVGSANVWQGNYWSDYQGFDRNGDGVGDTPHELYAFADRIWMETPQAAFFRNAPAMELIDFLERLAPFAGPSLILRDPRPVMR